MNTKAIAIAVLVLLAAVLTQLGQLLLDPSATARTIVGTCLVTFATTLGSLLVRLPQNPWTEEKRAAKRAKQIAEGGFSTVTCLIIIFTLTLGACSFLGLQKPESKGQTLVQTYVNATAAATLIPTVLEEPPLVSSAAAQDTLNATRTVHDGIDAYWDAAGLGLCRNVQPGQALETDCEGVDPAKVMAAINSAALVVTKFLMRYEGVKR